MYANVVVTTDHVILPQTCVSVNVYWKIDKKYVNKIKNSSRGECMSSRYGRRNKPTTQLSLSPTHSLTRSLHLLLTHSHIWIQRFTHCTMLYPSTTAQRKSRPVMTSVPLSGKLKIDRVDEKESSKKKKKEFAQTKDVQKRRWSIQQKWHGGEDNNKNDEKKKKLRVQVVKIQVDDLRRSLTSFH